MGKRGIIRIIVGGLNNVWKDVRFLFWGGNMNKSDNVVI